MSDLPHRHDRHEGTAHDAGEASHGTLPTDHGHSPDGDGTPGDPGHEHDHDHGHDQHPGGLKGLLADPIHNFADASTAIPLWLAFSIGRRPPNRRYTYGYGRAEDLAGVFVVLMIAGSSIVAGWESLQKLLNPEPITNIGWVA